MAVISVLDNNPLQVTVSGSIYLEDALTIRDRFQYLQRHGHHHFIVDLSAVDYIDGSGLGVLVGVKNAVTAEGGSLVVTDVSGLVETLFRLTKLKDFLCCNEHPLSI